MEEIFTSILNLISREIPELSLVDEDYGQLETAEDTYPVTFPCALIGNMEADWGRSGHGCAERSCYAYSSGLPLIVMTIRTSALELQKKRKNAYGWQTACTPCFNVRVTTMTWVRCIARKQGSIRCRA